MSLRSITPALTVALPVLAAGGGQAQEQVPVPVTGALRHWHSADHAVSLERPVAAALTQSGAPLGSMMSPGWRLAWDGARAVPGRMVVRLTLPVQTDDGIGQRSEVLQIGSSRDPAALRDCLVGGMRGAKRLPARVINGVRYTVWSNSDAGMSQQIDALDLRAVVAGACYAVDRFSYTVSAVDRDQRVRLSRAAGVRMMDAALASVKIGPAGRMRWALL